MIVPKFHTILILLGFVFTASCSQGCPSLDSKACECIDAYGKLFVKCTNAGDDDLKVTLTAMRGQVLTELYIKNSILRNIPAKLLRDISVSRIQIIDTALFYLFDRPIEGNAAANLASIKLNNVVFELGLDWSVFEEVKSLTEVVVKGTDLDHISGPITDLGLQLETLELSDDQLGYLYPEVFSGITGLKNLLLKNNLLQVFTRKMLPYPTSNLNLLDLSNNQLTSLPHDIFDGMPKINSLMLQGNRFTVLERVYMQKIWKQLFFFNVRENPLQCGCGISWIASGEKPVHTFGQCVEIGSKTAAVKQLKELGKDDFEVCGDV